MRFRMTGLFFGAALAAQVSFAQLEVGGDLLDNCADIDALQSAGNFAAARDKARLCLDGIEQQLTGEIGEFFLPEIGAWTRTDFEDTQVFGITNITATYEKADISAEVTLTGASGGGAGGLGAGFGGIFGGVAQNALLGSGQSVTVAGLPASVQDDGTITVILEDGSMLMFSSYDLDTAATALSGMGDLVNDFPVADINAALQ